MAQESTSNDSVPKDEDNKCIKCEKTFVSARVSFTLNTNNSFKLIRYYFLGCKTTYKILYRKAFIYRDSLKVFEYYSGTHSRYARDYRVRFALCRRGR